MALGHKRFGVSNKGTKIWVLVIGFCSSLNLGVVSILIVDVSANSPIDGIVGLEEKIVLDILIEME